MGPNQLAKSNILVEANRLLSTQGVALHHIDLSDHFSHGDRKIPAINFLQFSDAEWRKYAGNRLAYTNRLRVNEYQEIYRDCSQRILQIQSEVDGRSINVLKEGFALDPRFQGLAPETVCTRTVRILSRPIR